MEELRGQVKETSGGMMRLRIGLGFKYLVQVYVRFGFLILVGRM